ncbi:hypothetical protein GCM10009601_53820 [Streptomyces thermospinosisporus]|uniref:Translation initiation factor IF-2 n=2 Tax=Streptomyces thermospinosisporus TaxID=161482 RepID=A0ABP4JWL1_9ACTN
MLKSYAHPYMSRGGKCVRVEKWREDAQPEGPEAAEATGELPKSSRHRDREPATMQRDTGAAEPEDARPGTARPADATQVLRTPSGLTGKRPGDRDITVKEPRTLRESGTRKEPGAKAVQGAGAAAGAAADRSSGPKSPWDAVTARALKERAAMQASASRKAPLTAGAPADAVPEKPAKGERRDDEPAGAEDATAMLPRATSAPGDQDRTTALLTKPRTSPEDGEATRALGAPAARRSPGAPAAPTAPLDLPVRDPWEEDADDGAAEGAQHDPHEVTVQLDAVQFVNGELRRITGPGQEGSDGPVFVDESGRRSRRFRRIGLAVGLACAGYAVVIGATLLSGNSDAPWLPVEGQEKEQPADEVETTPEPGETDASPGSGSSLDPGSVPSAGASGLPSPGTSVLAPGTTVSEGQAGAATGGDSATTPSKKPTQKAPAGGGAVSTPPAETPVEPPADPTPTGEPADEATPPATGGGDGTGTDNVVGAPAADPVAADEPDSASPATPAAQSPEHIL